MLIFPLVFLALTEGGAAFPAAYSGYATVSIVDSYGSLGVLCFNNAITDEGGMYNQLTGEVTIPTGNGGVYWLSLRVYPARRTDSVTLYLTVNRRNPAILEATGERGVAAGVSAGFYLLEGSVVKVLKDKGKEVSNATMLSIVKTICGSGFTAVLNPDTGHTSSINDEYLMRWPNVLLDVGVGLSRTSTGAVTSVTIRNAGIYLVSMRADGYTRRAENDLILKMRINGIARLWAYSEQNIQASAAMAWQLARNADVQIYSTGTRMFGKLCLVSVVQIQGLPPSAVFTGMVKPNIRDGQPVTFRPGINIGGMYNHHTGITTITSTGIYVVCLRPDGDYGSHHGLTLDLQVNQQRQGLLAFSRLGVPQSVCVALYLQSSDQLTTRVVDRRGAIGGASLYSIAYVQ